MIVTLTRKPNGIETPGAVSAPGYSCDSLELPWKDNQHGISCIPAGTYNVSWGFMETKGRHHYQLQNVPERTGVFIHAGNYAAGNHPDVLGCILLGRGFADINSDGAADILHSADTVSEFEAFLGQQPFTLVITD